MPPMFWNLLVPFFACVCFAIVFVQWGTSGRSGLNICGPYGMGPDCQ
jgi:hypothetical protein